MEIYKIEIPVGEVFRINDVWLKCVESHDSFPFCRKCYAAGKELCYMLECDQYAPIDNEYARKDKKEVIYVKVNEKKIER